MVPSRSNWHKKYAYRDVYRMAITYFEMKCVGRVCVLISISNCRLYNYFVRIPATYMCVQLCFSLVYAVAIFQFKALIIAIESAESFFAPRL